MLPLQALRFYASYNVTVRDIKIINSPQCHLKFDYSGGVKVDNINISSPENSPNTDGIHLQNTRDVEIQHSNIGCGTLQATDSPELILLISPIKLSRL